MSIRITADTDTSGPVYHRWFPADAKGDAFGTINFGRTGHGNCLYFSDTASIDETIAALVALKQEMDPPAAGYPCVADAPDPEPLFPCCEHCIPACLAKPGYHAVACTTPGCPSAEAASVASVTA